MSAGAAGPLRCREPATGTVQVDDEHLRVVRWDFNPGAETGWHRHGFHYVVVPVTDGRLLIELPDGATTSATLESGRSYTRAAGVEHNVVNAGPTPLCFVEIEVKALYG